ncbi:AraC family transcriptional regulator [Aureibaculum conchae]|uniref:AraC family transcriptional regulator n=1 Tax=Aureibaculum sp. 2308TA14-22 TaxID=3108392 RepID=UPI00339A63F6
MDAIKGIRNLYTPLQPSVRRSNNKVSYCEHLPQTELLPYIYCYWELKTNTSLKESFTYRVVTDGCIDIFFELNRPNENYVMGFCKKFTEFSLDNEFHYVGIRFLPTAFPQLFKIDASKLSNQFQPIQNVSKPFSDFISNSFKSNIDSERIIKLLDHLLVETINKNDFNNDNRLYNAINIILDNFGVVNLESDIDTGISPRQLRRLFKYYIGATPKSFSKVVRFQNILKAKPSTQSLRKNKIFFDLGYFDQAHFIKEFKNFYGVTPSKAFGRE